MKTTKNDPDFYRKAYWLDDKLGKLVVVVSDAIDGGGVYLDENGQECLDIQYAGAGEMGWRFRLSVVEMKERFRPMGYNPVYLHSEERWMDSQEAKATNNARAYRNRRW